MSRLTNEDKRLNDKLLWQQFKASKAQDELAAEINRQMKAREESATEQSNSK